MKKNKAQGQTLLELVLALGLVVAIITAITVTTTSGLRSSEFSNTQVQATKLAQEGLEATKLIKEQNNTVCGPGTTARWDDLWTRTCDNVTPCTYHLRTNSGMCGVLTTENIWLTSSTVPDAFQIDNINYERFVRILDNGIQNRKEVVVEVSWTDSSGPHVITVSTILAQY